MSSWRLAGLNYVNYSNIAAEVLRSSLKSAEKEAAMKRSKGTVKYFYWLDGQMLPEGKKLPHMERQEKEEAVATG